MKIQRGIFQRDVLSSLLFVITMMPLNYILRNALGTTTFKSHKKRLTTLRTWTTLNCKQKNRDFDPNNKKIQPEYKNGNWHRKILLLIMKSVKRQLMDRIELTNPKRFRTLGKKQNYEYLGILEKDIIKKAEMKEKSNESIS